MIINIFLTLMIACAPQLVWASSPACSSSSSTSGVSKLQALTQELKRALLALDFERAQELVAEGADINITIDENGTTPLMWAAQIDIDAYGWSTRNRSIDFFAYAIRAGADLDAKDGEGRTVSDYAQEGCALYLRTVEMIHAIAQRAHDAVSLKNYLCNVDLNEWGFNVTRANATCKHPINYVFDSSNQNILMLAAWWNRTEDLRLLLNVPHIDIEACNIHNETALHESTGNSYFTDCTQLLIDSGAKINAKDRFGHAAIFNTYLFGNRSGIDVLYANGAQIKDIMMAPYSNCQRDTQYVVMYYNMAEKPTRQKYATDILFQEALQAWNVHIEQCNQAFNSKMISILKNEDTLASHMGTDQIKRCDAVIAKRSQLLSGGNILQLLKERETNPLHSSLLKRRLLQRVNALPEQNTK